MSAKNPRSNNSSKSTSGGHQQDADEVSRRAPYPPMLTHATSGPNNLPDFTRKAAVYFESTHGHAGTIIATETEFSIPEIADPAPDAFSAVNDPFGFAKALHLKRLEKRQELLLAVQNKGVSVCADLWALCSPASQAAVRAYVPPVSEPTLTYAQVVINKNPLMLWKIIRRTHLGGATGFAVKDAVKAQKLYHGLAQRSDESTDAFKQRTDDAIAAMDAAGVPLPSDELQGGAYIASLDNGRYAALKSELQNDEAKGLNTSPPTLLAAHSLAMKVSFVSVKTAANNAESPAHVYVAQAADARQHGRGAGRGGGRGAPGGGRGGGSRGNGRGNGRSRGNQQSEKQDASGAATQEEKKPCALCGKTGHWYLKCPDLARAQAAIRDPKAKLTLVAISEPAAAQPQHDDFVAFAALAVRAPVPAVVSDDDIPDLASDSESDEDLSPASAAENPFLLSQPAPVPGPQLPDSDDEVPGLVDVESSDDDSDSKVSAPRPARLLAAAARRHVNVRVSPDPVEPVESTVSPCVAAIDAVSATEVILDSGANASLFKNAALLTNVRTSDHPITVRGMGGAIQVDQVGDFGAFGEVYYSPTSLVNVLSFAQMEERLPDIEYMRGNGRIVSKFIIYMPSGHSVDFKHRRGLYIHDFKLRAAADVLVSTVEEREGEFTKREVEQAKLARRVVQSLAHPSSATMVKMIKDGSVLNSPVTEKDVQRADYIYGPDVAALKGKTKARAAKQVKIESIPLPAAQDQTLNTDVMFVNGEPYLINVAQPLGLTLSRPLNSRNASVLAEALAAVVNELKVHGFNPTVLLSDGEGGLAKIASIIHSLGMRFNPAGPNQHVPVIENKIKQIKERVRAVLSVLPFKLPSNLLRWLVSYCVVRLNMSPSTTRVDATCPRELFLGRKIDFKTDLRLSFGDYVQTHSANIIRNSMTPRTEGAIALTAIGNVQGSWKFYCLATASIITRDHWTAMPMPRAVIDHMNQLSEPGHKGTSGRDPSFAVGPLQVAAPEQEPTVLPYDPPKRVEAQRAPDLPGDSLPDAAPAVPVVTIGQPGASEPELRVNSEPAVAAPAAAPTAPAQPAFTTLPDSVPSSDEEPAAPEPPARKKPATPVKTAPPPSQESRYPKRENRTNWKDRSMFYGLHITVKKALDMFGDLASDAMRVELQQMLDLAVWTPERYDDLTPAEAKAVIFSSMFLKEKFTPDGKFDKLKARLVANGNQQDRSLYETSSVSSPAVSLNSVFMGAGIAAAEERHVVTMDIIGAYLKIDMTGKTVRVRLPAPIAKLLCELRPEYTPFLLKDGSLVVRLLKAMYGCVESGKLLFDHIRQTLLGLGFTQNPYDQCVFNKGPLASQCTIHVYVDDLLITCKVKSVLDHTVSAITGVYRTVKATTGTKHSYLGMTLDFAIKGECKITMDGYISDVLRLYSVTGSAASPATLSLFDIRDSPELAPDKRQKFHSIVAKLLYLAKRVRPELLLVVSFLATRVTIATEDDSAKLDRALKYLNGSAELGLVLRFDKGMTLYNYVDVSFGVHSDAKSHTGAGSTLGKGIFDAKSVKQKIVTKSSTEAELVGTSDYSSNILHKREYLLAQGYKMGPAVLFQDNQSTIAMLANGRPSSDRTRHVNIRYFFLKDRIDSGEITAMYKKTADMIADILTKPLQGELFRKLRAELLNWPV